MKKLLWSAFIVAVIAISNIAKGVDRDTRIGAIGKESSEVDFAADLLLLGVPDDVRVELARHVPRGVAAAVAIAPGHDRAIGLERREGLPRGVELDDAGPKGELTAPVATLKVVTSSTTTSPCWLKAIRATATSFNCRRWLSSRGTTTSPAWTGSSLSAITKG